MLCNMYLFTINEHKLDWLDFKFLRYCSLGIIYSVLNSFYWWIDYGFGSIFFRSSAYFNDIRISFN